MSAYRVDSSEADWNSPTAGHGHLIPLHGGYHAIPPKDALHNLRSEMCLELESVGVDVKYHHHEVGGPGQCEIETPLFGILKAGDATQIIKYVVKNRIDPRKEGFGPIDNNVFALSDEERRRIKLLPTSLSEACDALENDHEYLLAGNVFDAGQLADYIAHLRADDANVRNRPHPYEVGKYFDA